jgi:repressor LexA
VTLLLTPRQQEIFALIKEHIKKTGMPPTRAEIALKFGFRSANSAEEHLRALARKGFIELIPGTSRGIRLVESTPSDDYKLPVVGRVAAGYPMLAIEHVEEYCSIDPSGFQTRPDYLLRVRGESMRDAGILNGDLLAVKSTQDITDGQIVVARIDDEVTVKRFRRIGSTIYLSPENPTFPTMKIDLDKVDFFIEGLGVGVLRVELA